MERRCAGLCVVLACLVECDEEEHHQHVLEWETRVLAAAERLMEVEHDEEAAQAQQHTPDGP